MNAAPRERVKVFNDWPRLFAGVMQTTQLSDGHAPLGRAFFGGVLALDQPGYRLLKVVHTVS